MLPNNIGEYLNSSLNLVNNAFYPFSTCYILPYSDLTSYKDQVFVNKKYGFNWRVYRVINGSITVCPLLNLFFKMPFINCILIILVSFMMYKRRYKQLIFVIPSIATLLFIFVSPVAYLRYTLPIVYVLPLLIGYCMNIKYEQFKTQIEDEK